MDTLSLSLSLPPPFVGIISLVRSRFSIEFSGDAKNFTRLNVIKIVLTFKEATFFFFLSSSRFIRLT